MDDTTLWILVIAGISVVAAALIAVWLASRARDSRRLKQRFGPEYDRTLERMRGDRRETEDTLSQRISRRDDVELRALPPGARESYQRRWAQVQSEFVDRPDDALDDAQSLLDDVMVECGYPIGDDFDERADLVSVDHPAVAGNYRAAHRLHRETQHAADTPAATEKRRQALVHYRALFADLLGAERGHGAGGTDGDAIAVPDSPETDRRVRRLQ